MNMTDLLNLGKLPIADGSRTGIDIRNEEIYEQLTNQIEKRISLSGKETTDWNLVVKLSSQILLNHSKDILVCSYLCVGLLYTQNLPGLAIGVEIYRDILLNYWHELYPKRSMGRINAINWWIDSTIERLNNIKPEVWTIVERNKLEQNFNQILTFLSNNNVIPPDNFDGLIHRSLSLIQTANLDVINLEKSANNLNHKSTLSDNKDNLKGFATSINQPNFDNFNQPDLDINLDKILSALTKFNHSLLEEKVLSYQVFKINRFVAWVDIIEKPIHDSELKTLLPAPDELIQQTINTAYQTQNWSELIQLSETYIIDFRFWLDLSFYTYTALKHLNQTIEATEVMYLTMAFVKRLDGLENLLFADGTPFANPSTCDWINSFNNDSNHSSYIKSNSDLDLTSELNEIEELIRDNKIEDAISYLHNKIKLSASMQDRFLRILQFCQFIIKTGYGQLSQAYVHELIHQIKEYKLDLWDPELAANAYLTILNLSKYKKILKLDEQVLNEVLLKFALIKPIEAKQFY